MHKLESKTVANDEIIALLEKPKSRKQIRLLMKPIFQQARKEFGNAIIDVIEREDWGPNFDAYFDVLVSRQATEIQEFFVDSLQRLQDERLIFVLVQVIESDSTVAYFGKAKKTKSKLMSVA